MWNTGATYGYYWNGAGWTYDSSINDGLSTSYSYPTPSITNLNGVNKLIIGVADGTFAGYYWDVNSWVSDSTLISGLVDVGTEATPALYTYNNMWKVIAGDVDGTFTGYSSAPTYDNNTLINVDNVSSSFTSSDDAWILSCSAFDGSASSTWVNSSASTIGSTLTLESVSITPTSPQVTDDLLGYCNVSDSSNVNIGYAWEWYKDDVSFSSGNNLTGTWGSNTTIIAGLTDEGSISKPNAFYMGSNLKLISGVGVGDTTGFEWNGSGWDSDTSILSGIDNNLISYGAPSVYNDGGNFKMIMGNYSGEYIGYDWSGSSWSINSTLVNGLAYLGYFAVPTVFEYDDNWNLITGAQGGTFNGYTWNGTGWDSNTTLVNGLGDVGSNSAPIVFSLGGELKLISGESTNVFNGFEWNGTGWDSDTALISGLSNVGSGSQTVFAIDNVLRFITGNADGTFAGFDLTYPYTSNVLVNIDNLSSASTSNGEDWIFSCRGYNNDYSAWSNSSAVTITITPVIQTSDITPTVAYSGATTSIYGACNATDASSAALTYYYKWYKNDVLDTSGHNTTSLTEGITYNISTIDVVGVVDDEYIFSCLANSAQGNSSWLNSSTLTITNPAPVIVTSTILPASPFGSDDLLGYCNATDVNGDSLVYYYIWYKDDVEDSSGVSSSFTQGVLSNVNDIASANTAVGEVWKLSCRAYDGNTNSSALNSSGVTILNNAPTMVSTTLYPSATPPTVALYNFTGECKGSDGNSDTLTYYYRWYKNGAINNSGVSASGYTQNVAANISTYNITSVLNDVYIFSCLADDGTDNSSWLNSSTRTIGYVDGNVTLLLDGLGEARKYEYQTSINISANASDTGSYICLDIGYPGYGLDYTCDTGTLSYFLYLGDTSIYTFADGSSSYDFVYPYWSWISKSIKTDVRFDVDSATISLTGVQADYSITMFDDMTTASKTYTVADNSSFLLNLTVDSDMTFLGASFEITSPTNFTNISIDMFNDGVVDYNYNGTIDQYVSKTVTLNTTLLNANISGTTYQTIPFNFSVKSVNSGGQITVSDILFTKVTQSYPNDIKIDIGDDGTSDAEYKGALIGTTLYEDTNNDSESSTGMTCESSSCNYDMSFELNREQTYTTCYMYFLGSGIDSTFTEDFSDNDYMYSETLNVDNYFRQVEMDGTSGSYTNGEYISKTIRTMENTKYYLTLAASEQKDSGADIAYYVSLDNGSNWYQTVLNAPYFIAAGGKKPAYKFVMTSNAAKTANAYVTGVVLTDVGDYATDINLTVANTQHDYSGTFNAATGLYKANFGCTALNTYLDSCTALTCDVPVEINFTGPGTITASQYYFGGELDQAVLDIEVIKKHLQDAQLSTTIVNSTNDGDILNGSTVYAYLSFPRYSVAKDLFINITGGYER